MAKNYYTILNIPSTATPEEIRSAYRTRAKLYHPDHFGRDCAPFLRVQEAYEVLSDPASRRTYDRSLRELDKIPVSRTGPSPERIHSRRPPPEPLRAPGRRREPETIALFGSFGTRRPSVEEMLDGLWTAADPRFQPKADRFRTVSLELVLTPDQARRGGLLRVLVPVGTECPTCGGAAASGFIECLGCGGTGSSIGEWPLELELPPGLPDFSRVAVPLGRLGIGNVCLILQIRISEREGIEGF